MSDLDRNPDFQDLQKKVIELAIRLGTLFVLLLWCFTIVEPFVLIVAWGAIVAIARESPLESGRPITHWTQQELADEATSQRSVGRILKKEADLKPPPHAGLVERQAGRAL